MHFYFRLSTKSFCSHAACGGDERGFRGHPEPRQRASPSALPFCTREKISRMFQTSAKGFALCTPVLHEKKISRIFQTPAKAYLPRPPDPVPSPLPTHQDFILLQP